MTASVSSETGARFSLRHAMDLCAFVDRLAPDVAGEVVVARDDGGIDGSVFVEGGRVCWVAARGLAPRLVELLTQAARRETCEMTSLLLRCRTEGRSFAELLLGENIVGADAFRRAMFQHTVESLDILSASEHRATWMRRPRGFTPRFSFDTSEVLAHAIARARIDDATAAVDALAPFSVLRSGEWGAAFVRVGALAAAPLPIAVLGSWPDRSLTLMKAGKWAASTLDVSKIFQDDDALVTTIDGASGGAFVAWRHRELLVVGRLLSQGPARILNYRAAARRRMESGGGERAKRATDE